MDSQGVVATAVVAARMAAAVHRQHLGRVRVDDWSEKGIADYVTHVDREAEARITDCVRTAYPDHRILAEEEESDRQRATGTATQGLEGDDWTWIIDPLDGTTNYLHGYPMYAVSIAVARGRTLEAAVVVNSATGEEWTATRNGGARLGGRPVRVSGIERLDRALIGTGFPFKAPAQIPRFTRQLGTVLRASSGVRRAGSAALDLCHLATGWFDGFWELELAPWDVAAGTLIVREAGGVVTRLDGAVDVVGHGSILAGNPAVYAALGNLIRAADVERTMDDA
ncbi:MAG TPA: inositol monophosphatase family protein [Longimicrobiales bacterium]|nr:inositol monophosphatase family protein [Longimicrobiales bacterium]